MTNYLEEGDFFPFINIKFDNHLKCIHNYVDNKYFIILCVNDITSLKKGNILLLDALKKDYNIVIVYRKGDVDKMIGEIFSKDETLHKLLYIPEDKINIYIMNANRRIIKTKIIENIDELDMNNFVKNISQVNVPYLLIENVLSERLLEKIINHFEKNRKNAILHSHNTKNRLHVYPDKELEKEIDNKLSRSLFPEIRKIFYFDVKYRERYKICSYDAETNGRFHCHRDTPKPYQHRRYALSLFLNDDYEGGEFELPEYGLKIKPKKNTAFVFPGICSHKVNEVTKGNRRTMITFFCNEIEGKTKDNNNYKVQSNFFEENNIVYSNIYPM